MPNKQAIGKQFKKGTFPSTSSIPSHLLAGATVIAALETKDENKIKEISDALATNGITRLDLHFDFRCSFDRQLHCG